MPTLLIQTSSYLLHGLFFMSNIPLSLSQLFTPVVVSVVPSAQLLPYAGRITSSTPDQSLTVRTETGLDLKHFS